MSPEDIKKSTDTILDCFGGADGGVSFVRYRNFMEQTAAKAEQGDISSDAICNVVRRYTRLVQLMMEK